MLRFVISDGVLSFGSKKSGKQFVVLMNIWRLKYSLKKNKAKKLICGHLVFYFMNCYMDMLHSKVKEWIKFCCRYKEKLYLLKEI